MEGPQRPRLELYWALLLTDAALLCLMPWQSLRAFAVGGLLIGVPALFLAAGSAIAPLHSYVTTKCPGWWREYAWTGETTRKPPLGVYRMAFGRFLESDRVTSDPHLCLLRNYYRQLQVLIIGAAMISLGFLLMAIALA